MSKNLLNLFYLNILALNVLLFNSPLGFAQEIESFDTQLTTNTLQIHTPIFLEKGSWENFYNRCNEHMSVINSKLESQISELNIDSSKHKLFSIRTATSPYRLEYPHVNCIVQIRLHDRKLTLAMTQLKTGYKPVKSEEIIYPGKHLSFLETEWNKLCQLDLKHLSTPQMENPIFTSTILFYHTRGYDTCSAVGYRVIKK